MKVETVTRKQALAWINNPHPQQRPIDERTAVAYADDMKAGQFFGMASWTRNISVDWNDQVIDGLTRMRALVLSGKPSMRFKVERDLDPDDIAGFAIGERARAPKMAYPYLKNANALRARLAAVHVLLRGAGTRLTPFGFEALVNKTYAAALKDLAPFFASNKGPAASCYAAAFIYIHAADPAFAVRAARAWSSGDGLPSKEWALFRDGSFSRNRSAARQGGSTRFRLREEFTFRLLWLLKLWHTKQPVPRNFHPNALLEGLGYWSDLMSDSARIAWESSVKPEP